MRCPELVADLSAMSCRHWGKELFWEQSLQMGVQQPGLGSWS